MRERGILMSAPNVRSILAGAKSQTRRVVKPAELQRADDIDPHESYPGEWSPWIDGERRATIECPYGVPGDRLWVRETWARNCNQLSETRMDTSYVYRADGESQAQDNGSDLPWRPSIHMPRWACRIVLEITDVRVERLQEISEADAMAEGITHSTLNDPRVEYRWLWESINGPGSWDLNPYVWAITFRRIGDA